jgi:inner membrane protein
MDNITHSLTGYALARAGLGDTGRGATLALVLASNLPDVDVVTWLAGTASYMHHHRDLTHSVLGAPLAALALAGILRLTVKGSRLASLLLCSLLGVAGHVFMDLWTSYGTRVMSPFDRTWYAWDVVFIIDPWILLLLAAGLWAGRGRAWGGQLASVTLGLMLTYVGARALLHSRALDAAATRLPAGIRRLAALPHPLDPFRWRVLADTGDAYWTGELSLNGSTPALAKREKQPEDATVARARQADMASVFLDFSRFPWLRVEQTPEGTAVTWTDLRFEHRGRENFVTRIVVAPDGRIAREELWF